MNLCRWKCAVGCAAGVVMSSLSALGQPGAVPAAGRPAAGPAGAGAQAVRIERSRRTGLASVVAAKDGGAIAVRLGKGSAGKSEAFLDQYGHLFGVTDRVSQLRAVRDRSDTIGFRHTSFEQVHDGVPVFGGLIRVHENAAGAIAAANGAFFPIRKPLRTEPTLSGDEAAARARAALGVADATVQTNKLTIVDPGWYGDAPMGARLAYYLVLGDATRTLREGFFVDAHTGEVLDRWSMIHAAKNRFIHNGNGGGAVPGTLVRTEGLPPVGGHADIDRAYDYIGDTYDYYFRAFGRDSYDGLGANLVITVNSGAVSCPNAVWNGEQMIFCSGVVTDDVVAHELTHGVTQETSDLIYQNQPGQLNEAMSDIFGEMVDLFNGNAAFVGIVGGSPTWPVHPTGPGEDTTNDARSGCTDPGLTVHVDSPADIAGDYIAGGAQFGPGIPPGGLSGNVVAVIPAGACNTDLPLNDAEINGNIALLDRGVCPFVQKVKNAQNSGAIAVIVVNNVPGAPFTMGGSDPTIVIPAVIVSQGDGNLIRERLGSDEVTVTISDPPSTGQVRWLVGEDSSAFGGAIRDMWQPSCAGDPDHANHPFQVCAGTDSGGVHSGSGVPNHAFALMTDGGTYNGFTVTGIGPIKAGAVWFRAQAFYLTPISDFADAYLALKQAAADLVGTTPNDPRTGLPSASAFSAADAIEVDEALRAVEMHTDGACGQVPDTGPPVHCNGRTSLYTDDFEGGINGWTVSNAAPTAYDWFQRSSLPDGRGGTAWFIEDANIGDCDGVNENGVHNLDSPTINVPSAAGPVRAVFDHYYDTEQGFDGGNLSVRVNGGSWQLIPSSAILYNRYNMTIQGTGADANPQSGQRAYSGWSGHFATTVVDLSGFVSGGDSLAIRFVFGKDGCTGFDGWYVDNFEVFACPNCSVPGVCDDGNACVDDTCSEVMGCVYSATNCDDFDVCTTDSCVPASGCEYAFNMSGCDDGDRCTAADTCAGGVCSGTPTFVLYGDVAPPGGDDLVELADILCLLAGYALIENCPDGDIFPCEGPDGLIELGDVLADLAAYAGEPPCPDPCP